METKKYKLEEAVSCKNKNKNPRRHVFYVVSTMIVSNKEALEGLTCSKIIHAAIMLLMATCFYDNIL